MKLISQKILGFLNSTDQRRRVGVSLGVISYMNKMEELTVGALLKRMLKRGLVREKSIGRWAAVVSDGMDIEFNDNESIASSVSSVRSSRQQPNSAAVAKSLELQSACTS